MNKHKLRILILSMLGRSSDWEFPEEALCDEISLMQRGAVAKEEVQAALKWLNEKAYVDFTVEPISETKRWKITESGKAARQQ